jgi:GalNAc5-diNAcBac-PP-undecaprenol beta-1,3-glucosyltransferase
MLKNAVSSVVVNNVKIIITDDGSTDGTVEWCENLAAKNKNVIFVQNKKYKKGPNGNKNNGLDFVDTEFFTFLDDDDWFLPGALASMLEKAKEGYTAVFARCVKSDGSGVAGYGMSESGEFSHIHYLCGKFNGEFAIVFSSKALGQLRFDDEQYGAESVLWGNVLRGGKMYFMNFDAKMYRVGHTSVMTTLFDNAIRGLVCYKNLISEFRLELLKYCPKTLFRYYALMFLYASLAKDKSAKKEAVAALFAHKNYISIRASKSIIAAFLPLFILKKLYGIKN